MPCLYIMGMNVLLFTNVFQTILFLAASIHLAVPTPCDPDIPSRAVQDTQPETDAFLLHCDEGQYLDSSLCRWCPEGTFMTKKMAKGRTHQHCRKCYEPEMFEIVLEPCTITRDAKIMCEDQFYRLESPEAPCKSQCKRCEVCGVGKNMFKNFERRECQGHNNTVCCETEDTIVIGEECVRVSTIPTTTSTTRSTPTPEVTDLPELGELSANAEISVWASRSGTTDLNLHYTTVQCCILCVLYPTIMGIFR